MLQRLSCSFVCIGACLFVAAVVHEAHAAGWGRLRSVETKPLLQAPRIPELQAGYVKYDEGSRTFSYVRGLGDSQQEDAPALGSFSDPLRHKSNFGQLRITTNPAFSDEVQMQAAGFLEGYLTAERIFDYAYNMKAWLAEQTNDTFKVGDWLFAQDNWARQQVRAHATAAAATSATTASDPAASLNTKSSAESRPQTLPQNGSRHTGLSAPASASPSSAATAAAAASAASIPLTASGNTEPPAASYWPTVGLLLAQSDGLLAGYSARLAEQGPSPSLDRLTKWDFLVINALGDMDDLIGVVFPDTNDGGDTADYDVAADADVNADGTRNRAREPNPERDSSFFFRPPTPQEQAAAQAARAAEDREGGPRRVPRRGSWEGLTAGQVRSRIAKTGRCSALVKVTPGLDDLLLGHVTWWAYASMLRIYKHYDLRLTSLTSLAGGPGNGRVSFSSYPGQLSSADDWYLLGSGLVVTETSLDIYDHNRYNASYGCTSESLLSWQRVLAANLLAEDGPGWSQVAALYNSGTYNNQYMIVNLNLFSPGQELRPGLLTVMEIIPGMTVTADATADLERGHWPSYNVPYFPEVYEATGYRRHAAAMAAKGPEYAEAAAGLSYQLAPRAKIFRRDAASANDLTSFRRLLRSNSFGLRPTDPLAASSPWEALCGRGDLDPEDPDVYGCYDGKVTNYRRALELSADAINGPTTEGGQPPFRWDSHGRFRRMPHRGMIDLYDTEWEEQRP